MNMDELTTVNKFIASLRVKSIQKHNNMEVYFITSKLARGMDIQTFDEGIANSTLTVTEINDEGDVPYLSFDHRGGGNVYLHDGLVITQLKQTRTLKSSSLIHAGQKVNLPVFCAESGRWAFKNKLGEASQFALYADLRRKKARHINESLREYFDYRAVDAQIKVWQEISEKARRLAVACTSQSVEDIYLDKESQIREYSDAFRCSESATGMLVGIAGNIIGMDIFGVQGLCKKMFNGLVSSYAMDCIDTELCSELSMNRGIVRVDDFIKHVFKAGKEVYSSPTRSQDIRIESENVIGNCLLDDSRVIHVAAFAN